MKPTRRPRTIAELRAALAQLRSDDSLQRALGFRAQPTDVFIATYPKCGTTWMQQIVHGLRSGGSMAFDEISAAVPWLESAHDMGIDPADQRYLPRAFKTHFTWDEVPKGARYIYVIRDPRDVVISFYHFFEGWMFEPGSIALDVFTRELLLAGSKSGTYWAHVRSWWPQLGTRHVLAMCFEDLKADLVGAVERVARFIGCDDDAAIETAARQATFDFMHARQRQFDDHLLRRARDAICGLPPGDTTKVRAGRVGDHERALSAALARELDERWQAELAPLGLSSYRDLRDRLQPA